MPSAYLQWRLHSGERVVAHGPLVLFDVISSIGDGHFFPFFFFCCDYWFYAHAVTICSVLIYKFWAHLTEG